MNSELLRKISLSALKSTNETNQSNSLLLNKKNDGATFEFKDLKYVKVDFEEVTSSDDASVRKTVVNWIQTKL